MAFIQKILREVHCPRCNAIAQERIEDKERNVIIILWCDKCKLRKSLRITTRRALSLEKRQRNLRNSASQTKDPRTRARLNKTIDRLNAEIRRSELGI